MSNEIEITIKARDQTGDGFDQASGKANRLRGVLTDVGKTAAGFLSANVIQAGASKVTGFLSDSTGLASDLNESMSKSQQVFGQAAGAMDAFASHAAKNLGLSKGAALDATASFGNMFDQLGIGQQQSSAMSQSITLLAGDFASFDNVDIKDVIESQTSAFRGEYDSIQKFLPLVNAASVEQRAMAMTHKATTKELTAQDKALAVYALMQEGAGKARGDFAKTADGAANSERIAAAEMENSQALIGQKLLPVTMKLTQIKLALASALADKVVPALSKVGEWVQAKVVPALQQFADWAGARLLPILTNMGNFLSRNVLPPLLSFGDFLVGTIIPAIGSFVDWLARNQDVLAAVGVAIMVLLVPAFVAWAISAATAAASTLLAMAPIILIGIAIAALAYLIIHNWDTIKAATAVVFSAIVGFIQTAFNWVRDNWPLLLAILTGPIGLAVLLIMRNWDTIKNAFGSAIGFIRDKAVEAKNWIVDRFNDVVSFFSGLPGRIGQVASNMWNGLKDSFRKVINAIISLWNNLSFSTPAIHIGGFEVLGKKLPGLDIPSHTFRTPQIPYMASGGVRAGFAMVGERGRELVQLGAGKRVIGNQRTEAMLAAGGGRAQVNNHFYIAGSILTERDLMRILKDHEDRGGSYPGAAAA